MMIPSNLWFTVLCMNLALRKTHCERATSILYQIEKMLPNRFANVVVVPSTENEMPVVYGPSKGCASFWEAEFGDHVFIVLT